MRNRVQEFQFNHVFDRSVLKDVKPCPQCFATWVVQLSAAWDARRIQPQGSAPQGATLAAALPPCPVRGHPELMAAAEVSKPGSDALLHGLMALGAVDVQELSLTDWQEMECWTQLRPLEQRRLCQHIAAGLPR